MLFRFGQWLKYRLAAKGRHGVHSPFVFHLIKQALRPPLRAFLGLPPAVAERIPVKERELVQRLFYYLRPERGFVLPGGNEAVVSASDAAVSPERSQIAFRRLVCPETTPFAALLLNNPDSIFGADDVLLVSAPHKNPEALASWEAVKRKPGCTLTLDFYHCALVFFTPEFKEKQDLVIRVRG